MQTSFAVRINTESGELLGTGILVTPNHVVTAAHVLVDSVTSEEQRVAVSNIGGEVREPSRIAVSSGLALIAFDKPLPDKPAILAEGISSDTAFDELYAIGFTPETESPIRWGPNRVLGTSSDDDDSGQLLELQLQGGAHSGLAGAPVVSAQRDICVGMLYVGGEGASISRALSSVAVVDFLKREHVSSFKVASNDQVDTLLALHDHFINLGPTSLDELIFRIGMPASQLPPKSIPHRQRVEEVLHWARGAGPSTVARLVTEVATLGDTQSDEGKLKKGHRISPNRLRKLRVNKRLSIRQLAMLADVSSSAIYRIERGPAVLVQAHTLEQIAKALGVSTDAILERQVAQTELDINLSPIAGPIRVYIDANAYTAEEKGELLSLISDLYNLETGDRLVIDDVGMAKPAWIEVPNPGGGNQ